MSLKTEQIVGLREEINQMFLGHDQQAEIKGRLVEIGSHASIPKCRGCQDKENCLENGPKCADVRRTSFNG